MIGERCFFFAPSFWVLCLLAGLFQLQGCYYDTEQELYGGLPCDTAQVTYTATIQPILTRACTTCHGASPVGTDVNLSNYVLTRQFVEMNAQRFLGALEHTNGFAAMPPTGTKLPDCELNQIRQWVETGLTE
jgi:mono/diheme cytochrome c family protein